VHNGRPDDPRCSNPDRLRRGSRSALPLHSLALESVFHYGVYFLLGSDSDWNSIVPKYGPECPMDGSMTSENHLIDILPGTLHIEVFLRNKAAPPLAQA
jgi:hypothetical protein